MHNRIFSFFHFFFKKKTDNPYIKKYGVFSNFTIWIVDGNYIRTKINDQFANFGQHYRFNFIPTKEFWIDKEYGKGSDIGFYIDHLLMENKLMKKGQNYLQALAKANLKEKSERGKSQLKKVNLQGDNLIKKVHLVKIKKYSIGVDVWIVNGKLVRDLMDIDYTEGGHDKVYSFIPKNEIWLDDDLSPNERAIILLHEIHERNLMSKGMKYNPAHRSASMIECFYRHHPIRLQERIRKELMILKNEEILLKK